MDFNIIKILSVPFNKFCPPWPFSRSGVPDGHSALGSEAIEIQRYASNATFTVNLLHSIIGIQHVNILIGASNGIELLNFFAEVLDEVDAFGNPLLKRGDSYNEQLWVSPWSNDRACFKTNAS